MAIATKCTCGASQYCSGSPSCNNAKLSFQQFVDKNKCTEEEIKHLKAFLFAYRHNDIDAEMLEKIINKYRHIL